MNVTLLTEDDIFSFYVTYRDYTVGVGPSTSQDEQSCSTDGFEGSTSNPENADFS